MRNIFICSLLLLSSLYSCGQIFIGTGISGSKSLVINASGSGNSTTTTNDGFINCIDTAGVITGTCNHTYSGSPAIVITATAGANTTVAFANGTGSLVSCNGSSNVATTCSFTINLNSSISVLATTPANAAIPATYTGIDLNSLSTGCPPSGGHYPAAITHGRDRWWDLGQVQWSFVNTAPGVFNWTNVDSMGCAAAQQGVDVHWTMSRTPYWATHNNGTVSVPQRTDAGDCGYFSSSNAITMSTTPTKILAISNSDSGGNVVVTTDTSWSGAIVNNVVVLQDIVPTGLNGITTITAINNSAQFSFTVCCVATNITFTSSTNAVVSLVTDTGFHAPAQCEPPVDVNPDGSGTDQDFRDWIGAASAHVYNPTNLTNNTMARVSAWEFHNEPDTCKFFSCVYGSYDIQSRQNQDAYCILKGPSFIVTGGITNNILMKAGETVTQAVTGSTFVVMADMIYNSDLLGSRGTPTGAPDSTHIWTGGSSGGQFTPTAAPVQFTIRATGETCLQVRTAVTHGAGSSVVDTNIYPSYPTLPVTFHTTVMMGSYHPPDSSAKQAQALLYCNVLPPGVSATKEVCSSNTTTCGGAATTPCCQVSGNTFQSCHSPGSSLITEAINEHFKPGPVVTTPAMEPNMLSAIGQINAIIGTTDLAKPIFLTEGGYSTCGFPSAPGGQTNCDTSSPWGILEMQAAFIGDYYIYTETLGQIPENIWYNWNFANGGLGSACSGNDICADTAMDTVAQWLTGGVLSACSITNGAGTSSLYTCPLVTSYPDGISRSGSVIWDNAELCTGTNGQHAVSCPTASRSIDATFDTCWAIDGALIVPVGHAIPVGVSPQLCYKH